MYVRQDNCLSFPWEKKRITYQGGKVRWSWKYTEWKAAVSCFYWLEFLSRDIHKWHGGSFSVLRHSTTNFPSQSNFVLDIESSWKAEVDNFYCLPASQMEEICKKRHWKYFYKEFLLFSTLSRFSANWEHRSSINSAALGIIKLLYGLGKSLDFPSWLL